MGVYHLMGLGLSPGAVTGPISYLAELYKDENWEKEGKEFFARSGEAEQRQDGKKVGGIQLLVIFTTKEVIKGEEQCEYRNNEPGHAAGNLIKNKKMQPVIEDILKKEWSKIKAQGNTGIIYWVEVDRRDIKNTYERIAKVVASLAKGSGGQGKELWMNLTGGNNVINFALQMAASLSGEVARLYYVQAVNPIAETCVRYTNKDSYWVEVPMIPLVMSDLNKRILNVVEELQNTGTRCCQDIYGRLKQEYPYSCLLDNVKFADFVDKYMQPLWKAGLIATEENCNEQYQNDKNRLCRIGKEWEKIQQYDAIMKAALKEAEEQRLTIEKLAAEQETWITKQEIQLN
jgi:hypothetical protein